MRDIPLTPSFDVFEERASKGNLVPVYAELTADYETPLSAFHKISDGCHSFLLESAESTDRAGRYSFIGSTPRAIIEAHGTKVKITKNNESREFESESGDPLCELEEFMKRYQPVSGPELPSGLRVDHSCDILSLLPSFFTPFLKQFSVWSSANATSKSKLS